MKLHSRPPHVALALFIGLMQAATAQPSDAPAADSHAVLNAEEVVNHLVQRNLERARALGAYQGTRIYRLEYRGFPSSRSAEMIVDVKYSTPGTKEFSIRSEKGSQLIIERVFKRMLQSEKEAVSEENQSHVALNRDNYNFTLTGYESTATGSSYILSVEPRTSAIRLGGQANFTIDYQNYQITAATAVGTPDKLAGADGATSKRKSGQSCSI